ncbi:gp436 family protein [Paracoccus denitrificans]|uniref:gp436 family protein n=1 Tax=Paracoccus denitrificans TaxID=266 RepID=UPI003364E461
MPYASLDQLKAVIPARDLELLTDFDRTGTPSDARLVQALEDATAEINGWIGKVVTRPLAEPPHILTVICRDLAMHRLYVNLGHDMEVYDRMRRDALATLKSIAKGELAIGDDGDGPDQLTSPGVAMTDGPARLITRDSLKGY